MPADVGQERIPGPNESFADIYKTEALRRRECLYYISLGLYKMQEYSEAQRYIGMFPPVACRHP